MSNFFLGISPDCIAGLALLQGKFQGKSNMHKHHCTRSIAYSPIYLIKLKVLIGAPNNEEEKRRKY